MTHPAPFLCAPVLATALLLSGSAHADTPPIFPVQGVLTDAEGVAIDGEVSVRFALYDTVDGAVAVWEEARTLDVQAGAFTAYLGETADLDPGLFGDHETLWLGITVGADEEMGRVELGSAAYAAVAQHAVEVPADVLRGAQSCVPGDVVAGVDVMGELVCVPDSDDDTLYTGADFALSDQLCLPGEVVQGIDAVGQTICVLDADAQYTGTSFATAGQQCTPGNIVLGIDATGAVVCVSDANTTYSGVDFALSGQSCPGTALAVGFDGSGVLQCASTVPWTALTGVPVDLADGDQDTQLTEGQVDAFVANNNYSTGAHTVNTDTQLTEGQVDAFVANNNYSTGAHTVVNGQAITPSSVTLSGTSTALTNGTIDLGPNTDDALTAAMVTTLTGGGAADSLHSHAAQAASSGPTMMSAESTSSMTFGDGARYCRDLVESGFSDWWLPTWQEVWTTYQGTVVQTPTSSEWVHTATLDAGAGQYLVSARFSDGGASRNGNGNLRRVRCVR